ncbi:MAG: 2-5 ligase [Candidatus Eremiobacteraeota bacterium]|nr:2-5 ligase [Candidatus Eremiobacteraeota bacterium]
MPAFGEHRANAMSVFGEQRPRRRRLFVAADLDDTARAACANVAERLRAKGWLGKWVPPENYHLTVAFLGSVDADRVGNVITAVAAVAPRISSVDVPLDTVGAFASERKPRVAWVGPSATVPAFGAMCGVVRGALAAAGFELDARADPHVTLARSDGRSPLPVVEPPLIPPLRIEALTLYESFTERTGPRYEAVERFLLAPGIERA